MFNFADVSKLSGVLRTAYKTWPGEPGREELAKILEAEFGFLKETAKLYASTVLSRNVERSADSVTANANKVRGTWMTSTQSGMTPGPQKFMVETWEFRENLLFEDKRHEDESYLNSIGGGY